MSTSSFITIITIVIIHSSDIYKRSSSIRAISIVTTISIIGVIIQLRTSLLFETHSLDSLPTTNNVVNSNIITPKDRIIILGIALLIRYGYESSKA